MLRMRQLQRFAIRVKCLNTAILFGRATFEVAREEDDVGQQEDLFATGGTQEEEQEWLVEASGTQVEDESQSRRGGWNRW
jgi:hypothetical protein